MQTTVDIDEQLVAQAMAETGVPTQKAVIEAGLRLLLQMRAQEHLRELRGQLQWEGDLDTQRRDRVED